MEFQHSHKKYGEIYTGRTHTNTHIQYIHNTFSDNKNINIGNSSNSLNEKKLRSIKKMADTQRFSLISCGQHNILLNKWTNLANTQCFITFALIFMYLFSSDSIVFDIVSWVGVCVPGHVRVFTLRALCVLKMLALYYVWECLCATCMSMYRFIPAHYLAHTQIIFKNTCSGGSWSYKHIRALCRYVCLQHTTPQ